MPRLVLTRKPGESLYIGETKVTIERNDKGKVRLSIEAKEDVKILRAELVERETDEAATF